MEKCFFCDIQNKEDKSKITENRDFFSGCDDFPVSKGHCLIISKQHITSFFNLNNDQIQNIYDLIKKTKKIIQEKFNPDGYNIGINEGQAAGRTQAHLHIHLIPRYKGDIENPNGGIRNIFKNADYVLEAKKIPSKKDYV